jgi:Phosphoribosylaminoimidazole (AIR) synthetase
MHILELINRKYLNACANITGGGLEDNIKRIIPNKLCAEINLEKIKILNIFRWLKNEGIKEKEMLKTFNCGVGFCLIIKPRSIQ